MNGVQEAAGSTPVTQTQGDPQVSADFLCLRAAGQELPGIRYLIIISKTSKKLLTGRRLERSDLRTERADEYLSGLKV